MNKTDLQHCVLAKLSESAQIKVNYYNNLLDPEHKHNHGWSVAECLELAREDLDKIQCDIIEFKRLLNKKINPFDVVIKYYRIEFKDAIKQMIREYLKHAYNHSENHLIVWQSFRCVVFYKQWLNDIDSKYECVTARYFLKYN